MALRWDFKTDKLGWYEDRQTKELEANNQFVRLYDGNALMIACWENDNNDNYWMHSFFADEKHAKNCLKEEPIYPKEAIFHLYRNKPSCKKLARILTRYQISVVWEDEPDVQRENS